jgi:cytidine deaminase
METLDLINLAASKLKPHKDEDGRVHGDVAAAVLSKNGKVYTGICVDTPSWGLCAERSAIAPMITDGSYEIDKVVAVWRDPKTEKLHVLPPCGTCREFMRNIDKSNLDCHVILGKDDVLQLKDLIPRHEWPGPLEEDKS